ncbi:microsomal dipeptidase-like Zn-dependent dipeptidase [Tamaricihabitans halophyticus]|uniref:Microsomal dipeptidase-like Zn-dependent dipeptidase n=1 Tax=Tamaricihabitans halophyticus TaxID=1262583 RepID=A0A4R2Q8C5_9PSEU|nr:membrane dipeptidase [Tamaricihabitans halophyticus]TCP45060.1 microsomal dipeptidase-like Zn-dependent dipeptidase [Tamaricihabitans halophyticus]
MHYVDGLECSEFDREVFTELRDGGLSCVTVTCGYWGDALESMDSLAAWRELERENADLIGIARTAADIGRIAAEGRTAILLGFQNSAFLAGRIRFVELFADLGVRVGQLTYNIQNDIGASCYDDPDSGLTRFGREVVAEMNRVGMAIDLSHVGNRTSLEAIEHSAVPVAITHANAASLVPHARNKPDDVLTELAARGGMLGVSGYRNISGPYAESIDAWAEMVAKTVELIGLDHVGIGTDLGRKVTFEHLQWMRQGRWSMRPQYGAGSATNPGKQPPLPWFPDTTAFPAKAEALRRYGFDDQSVSAVMGGNWMRFYTEVLPKPGNQQLEEE